MRKKISDYRKEQYRGSIKQLMKVNRLRTISISNYNNWKQTKDDSGFHSIKLDIQDGYINLYNYGTTIPVRDKITKDIVGYRTLCGEIVNDVTADQYKMVHDTVMNIISDEEKMPSNIKRNVLVKMSR